VTLGPLLPLPVPSWAQLLRLMSSEPADEPAVRGAVRHGGPDDGRFFAGSADRRS
jgi:hypothetical protein